MTEPTNDPVANGNQSADQVQTPHIQVLGQYIRDLSFENPKAPASLQGPGENPNLKIEVNVNGRKISDDTYESAIHFNAKATNDGGTLYELEIIYGGAFQFKNIPENALQPVVMINCPTLLFPFLRRMVADLTREGGFPPLMMDPIDFGSLYAKNMERIKAQANEDGGSATPAPA